MANSLEQIMKRYIITTAQANAGIHRPFWEGLESYKDKHNAELIVLPTAGQSVNDTDYHPEVVPYLRHDKQIRISDHVRVIDAQIRPQSINPLTGVDHFSRDYESSVIFAGTKQVLKYVPDSNHKLPRAMMTTGAVTKPNYRTKHRIGNIAEKDHEYGAVILDVEDNGLFHHRFIQSMKNGKFSDIDGTYHRKRFTAHKQVDAMVLGDLHPFYTCPTHERASFEQIALFKPKKLFLHDVFNAVSISHHDEGRSISKSMAWKEYTGNLLEELKVTRKAVIKYAEAMPENGKVYIVKSNHDEHLERYLNEARFVRDPMNTLTAAKLYVQALEGNDPLKAGFDMVGGLPDNVVFLNRESEVRVRGYVLSNHGDLGANGGRGSIRSIENANGKSITGHTHGAMKVRNTYKVGTSTKLRLPYTRGYSSWTNTNAVVYTTGQVQLVNTIQGRWR